jgi:hypothetical protein
VTTATIPSVWALPLSIREGRRCLHCVQLLDDDRVPAGTAPGYWGAHNLSVTVYVHPECQPALAG